MYLNHLFSGRAMSDNRRMKEKTILHIETKGKRHTSLVMCVLYCGEKNRMLCHYGKRSLGHEQKTTKGLKGKNPEEKKREKELLQNIFHQLGMLSWDV